MINNVKVECDLQTLMTVLNATGNPKVAIKMLNGEYEEPFIINEKIGRWDIKKETMVKRNEYEQEETVELEERVPLIYHFVSYNPFTDVVTYKYEGGWKREETMSLKSWVELENPYAIM